MESSIVPAPAQATGSRTIADMLGLAAERYGDRPAVRFKRDGAWHDVSFAELGEIVSRALKKKDFVFGRKGVIGERQPTQIGFHSIRGGDIVGEHTVMFIGSGERIEITHRSTSRANYAAGSLRAARFIAERTEGLYDMDDVLGLR